MGTIPSTEIPMGPLISKLNIQIFDDATNTSLFPFGLAHSNVQALVLSFRLHNHPPVVTEFGLVSFFVDHSEKKSSETVTNALVYVRENFQCQNSVFNLLEILTLLILVMPEVEWVDRLKLFFQLFTCSSCDYITYYDIILGSQTVIKSLQRAWRCSDSDMNIDDIRSLSESLADEAFTHLEKELDETIGIDLFISWGLMRFNSGKPLNSIESLFRIMKSPHKSDDEE